MTWHREVKGPATSWKWARYVEAFQGWDGFWFNVGRALFAVRFGRRQWIDEIWWTGHQRYNWKHGWNLRGWR